MLTITNPYNPFTVFIQAPIKGELDAAGVPAVRGTMFESTTILTKWTIVVITFQKLSILRSYVLISHVRAILIFYQKLPLLT